MPHASARICHVASVARDDVDMKMCNGLPCRSPCIEADVVPVRARGALVKDGLDLVDQPKHHMLLIVRGIPPLLDRAPRHNEGMARGHRVAVAYGEGKIIRGGESGLRDGVDDGSIDRPAASGFGRALVYQPAQEGA
jgi:hypothetical protein